MATGRKTLPRRLDADELDAVVVDEGGKRPDRVRAAADARDDARGQRALGLEDLRARLGADHALQVSYECGVGRGADGRADHVVRALHVADPVANRLGGRLLERLRSRVDGTDARAEQFHALHVRALAAGVLHAHVDDALEAE